MISLRATLIAAVLLLSAPTPAENTASPASDAVYLIGGTVISLVPGQMPFRASVKIEGGRIAAIGPRLFIPRGARTVDVTGRYVLPGFIDMHAHVTFLRRPGNPDNPGYDRKTSEQVLKALLAYGVTTIRNPAAPPAESVALRDDVENGIVVGPRIRTAGWPLNGHPATAAAIGAEVGRQCALRVDYMKVYANSTPAQTAAAIGAAHSCGIKVIGHLQATDWITAANEGIDFVTHGVSWSASLLPPDKRAEYIRRSEASGSIRARIFWLESVDVNGPEMDLTITALKRHHVSDDPTLVAYETKFIPQPKYRSAANVGIAPPALRESWIENDLTGDWTADDYARMKRAWPKMLAIIGRYYREGVMLTTGTDLPNRFVSPGVSLDQEMALLHQCGIPNDAILAMATRNAAEALGLQADIGSLVAGKRADLVVLDKNPLIDIRNAGAVFLVVAKGRLFHPHALLQEAER